MLGLNTTINKHLKFSAGTISVLNDYENCNKYKSSGVNYFTIFNNNYLLLGYGGKIFPNLFGYLQIGYASTYLEYNSKYVEKIHGTWLAFYTFYYEKAIEKSNGLAIKCKALACTRHTGLSIDFYTHITKNTLFGIAFSLNLGRINGT